MTLHKFNPNKPASLLTWEGNIQACDTSMAILGPNDFALFGGM